MTTPENVHEVINEHHQFGDLVKKLDVPASALDLREAVRLLGDKTEIAYEFESEELRIEELGWLRLAWEAHHRDNQRQTVETSQ